MLADADVVRQSGGMARGEYHWCLRHHRVESGDQLCPVRHRLGPYPSVAEAKQALERVRQRNQAWDDADARWDGDDDR
jgi:hypothetical protein